MTNRDRYPVFLPIIPKPLDSPPFTLVVVKPNGYKIQLTNGSNGCGRPARFWRAKDVPYRGWFFLGSSYCGLDMPGRYTLHADWDTTVMGLKEDDFSKVRIVSNKVSFEIVEPKGADRQAASLVRMEVGPGSKEMWVFGFTEAGIYRDPAFCKKLAETRSDRFMAIADYFNGTRLLESGERREDRAILRSASETFVRTKASPESSRYLKGLAELELCVARCTAEACTSRRSIACFGTIRTPPSQPRPRSCG